MFSIVSMQEVLINLNGGDNLFKLFEGPRSSKKRGISTKAVKEKPILFIVQQIWILPSHILILMDNAQKLLAYDQVPRLGLQSKEETDLLSPAADCVSRLLDVIHIFHRQEYVLLLLKNGEIIVWTFLKPSYEWNYLSRISLCKSRNSQIISYVYSEEENLLVWCEKRGATKCYVFRASIKFSRDNGISVIDTNTILHNSLPMHIYLLPKGCCFMPVAIPPGLLLFWSNTSDVITVHMWNDGFDKRYIPTSASDFQSIITTCISLWIHSSNNENKFFSIATHPSTKELIVLQNDLQVYIVGHTKTDCRDVVYLCTLEVTTERDTFAKQIIKVFPFQHLLLLVMSDGIINIFDTRGGLFLWKTETFRNNAPQIWTRLGYLPTIGTWNRSGIWNLRPKPVCEQIKSFQQEQLPKENLTATISNSFEQHVEDVEFAIDVFDGHLKKQNKKPKRRIKQGVNRCAELPTRYLFQMLAKWQLMNISTDIAINIAMHIKDILRDENSEEEIHMEEMTCLIDEIKDPVLLVVLFSDKDLPYYIRKEVLEKLLAILELSSSKYMDMDILTILKEYNNLGKQIEGCYCNVASTIDEYDYTIVIRKEFLLLESFLHLEYDDVISVDHTLNQIYNINSKYCMELLLSALLPTDELCGTYFECKEPLMFKPDLELLFWKALLRLESLIFEKICLQLWSHAPTLMQLFLKGAEKILSSSLSKSASVLSSMEQLISKTLEFIWLPLKMRNISLHPEAEERARIYCRFLQMSCNDGDDEAAYEILLDNWLIDDAIEILVKYADNTQKHYSLFYQMIEFLLSSKTIGNYAERLKGVIPEQFDIAEIYNVFLCHSTGSGSGHIFNISDKDLSIGMLKPLLEEMLKE